jgi:hypothetical protein
MQVLGWPILGPKLYKFSEAHPSFLPVASDVEVITHFEEVLKFLVDVFSKLQELVICAEFFPGGLLARV